ncbi:transposable element Tcb2 transposase [Trichonephila clavipes]|nr:transposable element Tcb2 transposase [Trichonephila clavipes]
MHELDEKSNFRLKWTPVSNGKLCTPSVLCWDHRLKLKSILRVCIVCVSVHLSLVFHMYPRGVGTSGSESRHLDEDHAQDALYKPVVEKTATSTYDNRVRVWRPHGERLNPAFALQLQTTPTAGVMACGFIAYNTRSPLVSISGTMTAQRKYLRTVTKLSWPARSPDMSPIEHIWDHLGRRVVQPTSLNEQKARATNPEPSHFTLSINSKAGTPLNFRTHFFSLGLCLQAPLSHSPFPHSFHQSGSFLSIQDCHFRQAPKDILIWDGGSLREQIAQ